MYYDSDSESDYQPNAKRKSRKSSAARKARKPSKTTRRAAPKRRVPKVGSHNKGWVYTSTGWKKEGSGKSASKKRAPARRRSTKAVAKKRTWKSKVRTTKRPAKRRTWKSRARATSAAEATPRRRTKRTVKRVAKRTVRKVSAKRRTGGKKRARRY